MRYLLLPLMLCVAISGCGGTPVPNARVSDACWAYDDSTIDSFFVIIEAQQSAGISKEFSLGAEMQSCRDNDRPGFSVSACIQCATVLIDEVFGG